MSVMRSMFPAHDLEQIYGWQTFVKRVAFRAGFATLLVAAVGLANAVQTPTSQANSGPADQAFIVELQVSGQ